MTQVKVGAGLPPIAVQVRIISSPSWPGIESIETEDTGTKQIKNRKH